MTNAEAVGLVGAGRDRVDGPLKVTGAALTSTWRSPAASAQADNQLRQAIASTRA
jgi:hypothetical protein